MLEPWNNALLLPPPVNTTPVPVICDSMKKLKQVLNNITAILSKQSPLHKESALVSRFIYKFDKKFRNDISYRNLKKVNTALRKYLGLNLLKDIEYFSCMIPSQTDDAYLPTKQMLQYILVRLMTFSKIMLRICVCSKQGAIFYMDRIKRGESHWMSLMPYALMSRVWSTSMVLLEHTDTWYNNLYMFLDKLCMKGIEFLPVGYELPDDLRTWLDLKSLENCGRYEWSLKKHLQIDSHIIDNVDGDIDSILDYVKDVNNDEHQADLNLPQLNISRIEPLMIESKEEMQSIDKGESISREYFKKFFNVTEQSIENLKHVHLAENVTNKPSLQQFLHKEELLRNSCNDKSLTKHLGFMQWQTLKAALSKLCDSLANNRKLERKFQKIWKEKCLDYVL